MPTRSPAGTDWRICWDMVGGWALATVIVASGAGAPANQPATAAANLRESAGGGLPAKGRHGLARRGDAAGKARTTGKASETELDALLLLAPAPRLARRPANRCPGRSVEACLWTRDVDAAKREERWKLSVAGDVSLGEPFTATSTTAASFGSRLARVRCTISTMTRLGASRSNNAMRRVHATNDRTSVTAACR